MAQSVTSAVASFTIMHETMKIFALLVSLLLITGCAKKPLSHIPARTISSGVDFTAFTDREFLFTPERYVEEYESIGVITVTMWPEANREVMENARRIRRPGRYTRATEVGDWVIEAITIQDALEAMYQLAAEMGANAVINLEITRVVEEYGSSITSTLVLQGIEISGFAIRRL